MAAHAEQVSRKHDAVGGGDLAVCVHIYEREDDGYGEGARDGGGVGVGHLVGQDCGEAAAGGGAGEDAGVGGDARPSGCCR